MFPSLHFLIYFINSCCCNSLAVRLSQPRLLSLSLWSSCRDKVVRAEGGVMRQQSVCVFVCNHVCADSTVLLQSPFLVNGCVMMDFCQPPMVIRDFLSVCISRRAFCVCLVVCVCVVADSVPWGRSLKLSCQSHFFLFCVFLSLISFLLYFFPSPPFFFFVFIRTTAFPVVIKCYYMFTLF